MKTLREYLRLFLLRWFGYDPKPRTIWKKRASTHSGKLLCVSSTPKQASPPSQMSDAEQILLNQFAALAAVDIRGRRVWFLSLANSPNTVQSENR